MILALQSKADLVTLLVSYHWQATCREIKSVRNHFSVSLFSLSHLNLFINTFLSLCGGFMAWEVYVFAWFRVGIGFFWFFWGVFFFFNWEIASRFLTLWRIPVASCCARRNVLNSKKLLRSSLLLEFTQDFPLPFREWTMYRKYFFLLFSRKRLWAVSELFLAAS